MKLSLISMLYSLSAAAMSICCKYHLVEGIRRSKNSPLYDAVVAEKGCVGHSTTPRATPSHLRACEEPGSLLHVNGAPSIDRITCIHLDTMRQCLMQMALSYRAAIKGREYWRLGTGLLLFNLDSPLDIYTLVALYSALSALERRCFRGSPGGMITGLVFVATILLAPGFYIRELRLKEPSTMFFTAIVTWAFVRCFGSPGADRMLLGLAPFVPMIAPHFRNGEVDFSLLKHQGMAVAAGLACFLLFPDSEGARDSRGKPQSTGKSESSARNEAPKRTGRVGQLVRDEAQDDPDGQDVEPEEEEEEDDSEDESEDDSD